MWLLVALGLLESTLVKGSRARRRMSRGMRKQNETGERDQPGAETPHGVLMESDKGDDASLMERRARQSRFDIEARGGSARFETDRSMKGRSVSKF